MTTIAADSAHVAALAIPLPYDAPAADILDAAAQVMNENGRYHNAYWEDAAQSTWYPGMPCCVVGAIGIAIGARRARDVDGRVVPCVIDVDGAEPPHPAVSALMAHLGMECVQDLFVWSDRHEPAVLVAVMRNCAAALRTGATL